MTNIALVSLLSNLGSSHTKFNASSTNLEQTFVWRDGAKLISQESFLKNVRRNKKVYTKCESEKVPKVDLELRNRS